MTIMTSDSNHLAKYPDTTNTRNCENIDGVNVIWFKNRKYQKTASVDRILSWFSFEWSLFNYPKQELEKPDAIIVSSLSLLSVVYGWYLKRYFKAPLIFEVRDIWPLTLVAEGGFSKWHPITLFLGLIEKFGYRKADLVVGTMPRLDKHVEKLLGYPKPFFCSPLGFDERIMESRELIDVADMEEFFPKDKVIVGYAGSMGTSNNLEGFIGSIYSLDKEGFDDLHFVLVGAGDLRDSYRQQLVTCRNVTFVPRISAEKVPGFLSRCDVLYLSTHASEVWEYGQSMNKVVEYMYSGKPIVDSYFGYPSMIDEAGAGTYVSSNDSEALQCELKRFGSMSIEERRAVGQKGRSWIMEHRPYRILASEYGNQIERLISLKPRP